jgi:hypothetical protein
MEKILFYEMIEYLPQYHVGDHLVYNGDFFAGKGPCAYLSESWAMGLMIFPDGARFFVYFKDGSWRGIIAGSTTVLATYKFKTEEGSLCNCNGADKIYGGIKAIADHLA